ncbi:hypothetical protein BC939DRAFT_496803 [Gamsiella multidivaricata]|uniref:uncharacterized protein n=1 Tax=Gamsiella multidivaricata TaxID=101098 RepID=UPI00221FDA6F|nr:uncharacterized protein BC939DRAFT_496803 [Gamsiella multidivaricata]KAI7817262.1 hypothetical protein BC939DRAFT_496803 [Gamsiella multidivaricata]
MGRRWRSSVAASREVRCPLSVGSARCGTFWVWYLLGGVPTVPEGLLDGVEGNWFTSLVANLSPGAANGLWFSGARNKRMASCATFMPNANNQGKTLGGGSLYWGLVSGSSTNKVAEYSLRGIETFRLNSTGGMVEG